MFEIFKLLSKIVKIVKIFLKFLKQNVNNIRVILVYTKHISNFFFVYVYRKNSQFFVFTINIKILNNLTNDFFKRFKHCNKHWVIIFNNLYINLRVTIDVNFYYNLNIYLIHIVHLLNL